ncbi:hypothetical protein IMCC3317_03430 [Kordia antarctica]|uniref:Uncharacterized protein n=1 Tax=Kordia antarctica TaxID=1218801 RepID=A0A7L4ZEI8_9FLAO|nr:hypothetical protein [Kordia antarctica]QHI34997.1 hypothetical protein IMCC3317_03430 [Kordia antarctica]
MKKLIVFAVASLFTLSMFTSCEEKTKEEKLVEEMKADGAEIKVNEDGTKIKMETEDKSVKIKKDDGETKIKIKEDNE